MTVISFNPGDLFVFRVLHSMVADPNVKWYNTYELKATGVGSTSDLEDAADLILTAEAGIALTTVHFDAIKVSTWVPDSHPYDPLAFISFQYNDVGQRAPVGDVLPLSVPLAIYRKVAAGRAGRLFLRGLLVEADVQGTGSKFAIAPGAVAAWNTLVANFAGELVGITTGATVPLDIVMISGEAGDPEVVTRNVTGFTLGPPTMLKMNHKYFDRA